MPDAAALVGEAKELLANATPRPWRIRNLGRHDLTAVKAGKEWAGPALTTVMGDNSVADADLLARAPTLIAQLCDALEAAEAEVAELESLANRRLVALEYIARGDDGCAAYARHAISVTSPEREAPDAD
jgi:hypothetical protein